MSVTERARTARALALLATTALGLAALADLGHALAAGASALAFFTSLVAGAARTPALDARADVARAVVRLAATALAWGAAILPGPLGFDDTAHAVAALARSVAVVLAVLASALGLSPVALARLATRLDERRVDRLCVAVAVLVGIFLVARELRAASLEPLAPDAQVFRSIALRDHDHPYDTGFREPLHVWLLCLLGLATGAGDLSVRLLTVVLHAAAAGAFYAATRAFFGRGFAAIALLLYTLSTWTARMSVLGLRSEEVVLTVLLTVFLGRRAVASGARRRDAVLAGVASGLASLTYLSLLATTQAWLLGMFLLARAPLRRYALALAPAVLLVVPHLVYEARTCGDPFMTLNMHAVFYRNVELAGRPGYPTREEVARDAYCGPRTTALRWMVVDRSPGDAVATTARGAARLATYRSPAFDAYRPQELGFLVWIAAWLGFVAIIRDALHGAREALWVPLLVVLGSVPVVFPLGTFVAMEPRLVNQFFFAWLWLVGGLVSACRPSLEPR